MFEINTLSIGIKELHICDGKLGLESQQSLGDLSFRRHRFTDTIFHLFSVEWNEACNWLSYVHFK